MDHPICLELAGTMVRRTLSPPSPSITPQPEKRIKAADNLLWHDVIG